MKYKELSLLQRMGTQRRLSLLTQREVNISEEGISGKERFSDYSFEWNELVEAKIISKKKEMKLQGTWTDQVITLKFPDKSISYNVSLRSRHNTIEKPKEFVQELEKYIKIQKIRKKTIEDFPQWLKSLLALFGLIFICMIPRMCGYEK